MSGIGTMVDRIPRTWPISARRRAIRSRSAGVTDHKRKLAAKMGVDPYTDFPPLDARLSRLAEAAAAGGLTVSVAMLAVPVGRSASS